MFVKIVKIREPKGAAREPTGAKREPKGARREPTGHRTGCTMTVDPPAGSVGLYYYLMIFDDIR